MPTTFQAKEHIGLNRTTSEDVFRVYEQLGLFLVCDGSQDRDGRWAAETVCELIRGTVEKNKSLREDYRLDPTRARRLQIEELLHRAVQEACAAVHVAATEGRRGRTVTAMEALLVLHDYAISAHVGNTRLYLLSGPEPILLTQDHTLYEEMAQTRRGVEKINPSFKHQLTRALGPDASVAVDPFPIPLVAGSMFLLCSNGLSDTFTNGTKTLLELRDSFAPELLAQKLLDHAIKHKSEDNVTALLVRINANQTENKATTTTQDIRKQLELLKKIDIFQGIRNDLPGLFRIHSLFDYRRVTASGTIVQEGSLGDEMFILLSGHAEVRVGGERVDIRAPGDAIGEMGFFNHELRSATVVASEPCVLMALNRRDFDALVEKDPRLGYRVAQGAIMELSKKLKIQSERLTSHS